MVNIHGEDPKTFEKMVKFLYDHPYRTLTRDLPQEDRLKVALSLHQLALKYDVPDLAFEVAKDLQLGIFFPIEGKDKIAEAIHEHYQTHEASHGYLSDAISDALVDHLGEYFLNSVEMDALVKASPNLAVDLFFALRDELIITRRQNEVLVRDLSRLEDAIYHPRDWRPYEPPFGATSLLPPLLNPHHLQSPSPAPAPRRARTPPPSSSLTC